MKTYTAIYMPMSDNPPQTMTFKTKEEAENWILQNCLCKECQKEYQNHINNVVEDDEKGVFASPWPACASEWDIEENYCFELDKDGPKTPFEKDLVHFLKKFEFSGFNITDGVFEYTCKFSGDIFTKEELKTGSETYDAMCHLEQIYDEAWRHFSE
jgi:hypothetical protein